jgi:tellurite resistance protein TerC
MAIVDRGELFYWAGFILLVLIVAFVDLILLNRKPSGGHRKTDVYFLSFIAIIAAAFGAAIWYFRGRQSGLEFASGYLLELSLSIDNLFVFLLLFRSFGLDEAQRRKALLYGVVGAMAMRGVFVWIGITLLRRFESVQIAFGMILLAAALRLLREKKEGSDQPKWIQQLIQFRHGAGGTLLLSAVVAVELVDVVFALDSVPAVLAITHDPFIAYTSNILAILGLRSLYFLIENLLERLRYLHYGLAIILGFVGFKMVAMRWVHISTAVSLAVIVVTATVATVASRWSSAPQPLDAKNPR